MRFFVLFCLALPFLATAQNTMRGQVTDNESVVLPEALVYWTLNPRAVVVTDSNGNFEIPFFGPDTLNTTLLGYASQRFVVADSDVFIYTQLTASNAMSTVTVEGRAADVGYSTLNPLNVESIGAGELRKAPCCNLSEAFETNAAVDVSYADAVTGAREIQLLGLRGTYTLLQIEGRPAFYGLGAPYALEYVPGSWLRGIQISKGVGSVLSGFQTIAGQVNIALQRPDTDNPLFVNVYAEQTGRYEANVHFNKVFNKRWSQGLLLHGSTQQRVLDHNHDSFADMPQKQQLNGLYRLRLDLPKWCIEANVHALTENRRNGQLGTAAQENPFIVDINTQRAEVFGKIGYTGFTAPYKNMGFMWSALLHNTDGAYGNRNYKGQQRSGYLNYLYTSIIGTSDHKITLGSSLQADDYKEQLDLQNLDRQEITPGVLAEYNYEHLNAAGFNNFSLIGGLRADHNSRLGLLVSPRLHVRYSLKEESAIRFNVGRGYRSANLIPDNIGMLATNREIVWPVGNLPVERAWSFGANAMQHFELFGHESSLNVDLYHTIFEQQIVADYDADPTRVYLYTLDGRSRTTALVLAVQMSLSKTISVRLGYKYVDPQVTLRERGLQPTILQPQHRGLITATWQSKNTHWMINGTAQMVGPQRLPDHSNLPVQYRNFLPQNAPAYALFNAQANYLGKKFDTYIGCENIAGYSPHNVILASNAPQSPWFDATQIYAPNMKQRIYVGVRFRINKSATDTLPMG